MKVTLIYPGIVRIGFNSLGKGGMDRNWINLGLAYIGAFLRKNHHNVNLIDLRGVSGWDELEDMMRDCDSDVFGVYFNTPNYNNSIACCKIAKRLGKVVVAGGPHATILPQELLSGGNMVDYVIRGEGELSFLELLNNLEMNRPQERIMQGKSFEDLDELPFPDRDLYDIKKVSHPLGNFPFMDNGLIMMTSRGCPYNCAFCQPLVHTMFGRRMRYRSVEGVIQEIKQVVSRYKVRYISFQDDTFTVRKDWVKALCRRIRQENLGIQWSAQSRVDIFDEELARVMSGAGCVCIFFGFESGSQRILDLIDKGIRPDQSIRAAGICNQQGILIFADYMLGIPTETEDDLNMTLELIKRIRPQIHSPTYFTPIPGCSLYEYCRDNGLINVKTYEDLTRNPQGAKINGVDYLLLERYSKLMLSFTPYWFEQAHYARLALKRWIYLFAKGYPKEAFTEIVNFTLPWHLGILTRIARLLRMLKVSMSKTVNGR